MLWFLKLLKRYSGEYKKNPGLVTHKYFIIKEIPESSENVILSIKLNNKDISRYSGILKINITGQNGKPFYKQDRKIIIYPLQENVFNFPIKFDQENKYFIRYIYLDYNTELILEKSFTWGTKPVNFFYSFATPHRITIATPNSGNKTLLDVEKSRLVMSWSYENLDYYPYDSFRTPRTDWKIEIQPLLDSAPFQSSSWERLGGFYPVLKNTYEGDDVKVILEVSGANTGAITKIEIINNSQNIRNVRLNCLCPGNWKGYNPGWIDNEIQPDHLLAGWNAPADKIIIIGLNADGYSLTGSTILDMNWSLQPGESKNGWLIRPYGHFSRDIPNLKNTNWQEEYDNSINIWNKLFNKSARVFIPDSGVTDAFYACLADLFVMREPVGKGYIAGIPGTEVYRSAPNILEPAIVALALDQLGLHEEAEEGYRLNWDLQTEDGDWTEPGGWGHLMWGSAGFKAWALIEHFYNTNDLDFLKEYYPKLIACSRWQHKQREKTKKIVNGEKSIYYGLMPKGMGDGGLLDGNDYYGIFYTHNIWAVYADHIALKAAEILNKKEDAEELKKIYEEAKADLLTAMEKGAIIEEDGSKWLSGVPGKETGSCWGVLNAAFPTGILPPDHELITGTLRHVEKIMSAGGIPIHTGWMVEGMWVAITLDNFAEVHLQRDEGDIANAFLYATLNHGTPLYSWCEERGQEPNSSETSGDRQHLWTPVAVVRFIRDMLVMEQDNALHLARGIARGWLFSGNPIGIENASTRFGKISYKMYFDKSQNKILGEISFPENGKDFEVILHCLLPDNLKIISANKGVVLEDGFGLKFSECFANVVFEAKIG